MKPRRLSGKINPMIWTKQNGHLVGEIWVPCIVFAEKIGRRYLTVLDWMRKGLIPAMEFGTMKRWTCLTPMKRALRAYKELKKSGRIYRSQLDKKN